MAFVVLFSPFDGRRVSSPNPKKNPLCSPTNTKQSPQYIVKTHQSGPPMPKFEVNMNYIPARPPSSMKPCNKSATVKLHMELHLTILRRPGSNLAVVRHHELSQVTKVCLSLRQSNDIAFTDIFKKKESIAITDALILFLLIRCC